MKRILLILGLVAGTFAFSQEFKVKLEGVKISFIADMQNTAGTIGGLQAKINFNPDNLQESKITGTVDVNTLSTSNEKRDDHLKSADFFEVDTYPTMSFESKTLQLKGDKYIMTGTMKIKDVEREETITFSFEDKMFKGECTIQAANYNFGYEKKKPAQTNVKINFAIPVE